MHCDPPNQDFGWAMAHLAHDAAPPWAKWVNVKFLTVTVRHRNYKTSFRIILAGEKMPEVIEQHVLQPICTVNIKFQCNAFSY